jgi:hypothetical protein
LDLYREGISSEAIVDSNLEKVDLTVQHGTQRLLVRTIEILPQFAGVRAGTFETGERNARVTFSPVDLLAVVLILHFD